MKHQDPEAQTPAQHCCVDEAGAKRPYHLCCSFCRAAIDHAIHARLLGDGTAPDECGPDVVHVAPARGKVRAWRPSVSMPDGAGGHKLVDMGYRDRSAMVQEDVFDRMNDQVKRRGGTAPFTRHQIGAARDYRALHERVASAGIKCSEAFDVQAGGSGGVDFMVAYMRDSERLAQFHSAIGKGMALRLRRCPPSAQTTSPPPRVRAINVRDLVDMVCLHDKALSEVLRARGWPVAGKTVKTLRAALCAALGCMEGI